jgi:hypothetical protein
MTIKLILASTVILLIHLYVFGQIQNENIIYRQKVLRDDRMFENMFKSKRGELILTSDSLRFICKDNTKSKFNFSIPYYDIESIKPYYGFLIPNRIKIKTYSGKKFRLFTYKKRMIIKKTRKKMDFS